MAALATHAFDATFAGPLSRDAVDRLLAAIDVGSPDAQVLRKRPDCMVVRTAAAPGGGTVVVKLWARPGLRGAARRLLGMSPAAREFKTMSRMRRYGASVPAALGCGRPRAALGPYTDALVMEDLGSAECAVEYFKRVRATGDERAVRRFEDEMIELTAAVLRAGFVDSDHGMVNMVASRDGHPVRLDFELARRVPSPLLRPGDYAKMIGRIVGNYTFSVQPDLDRVPDFARRLVQQTRTPRAIVERGKRFTRYMIDRQAELYGIRSSISMDW